MKKICIEDIVIKTPGIQIREKIIQKFGSIKAFAEKIELYENSVNQYLSSKKLGSANFKIRTMNVFGIDFEKLYMSEEEQVRYMTTSVSRNIEDYNKFEDIYVFEKLKMICIEKEKYEDYAIVCRCYAKYFMNKGKNDRAYAYIGLAVNAMRGKDNIDRFGLYLSDLIAMKAKDCTKSEINKLFYELYEILKKIDKSATKASIYSNLGEAFYKLGNYAKSKLNYRRVLKYDDDCRRKAFVYTKIGDMEKYLGYDKQTILSNYKKAEELLSTDDNFIKHIYHEYAVYYFKYRNLKKAEKYIDRIFLDTSWKISASNHSFLVTFINIKKELEKYDEILNVINRLLYEIDYGYIYTISHLYSIDKVINSCYNINLLKKLEKSIINYYRNHELNYDYKRILRMILGSISINCNKFIE